MGNQLESQLGNQLENQFGSGLQSYARNVTQDSTQQFIFLSSDPDELVDQLKLLYFEKIGGNDNPQLNEQMIAIIDKLLEYECITTNQHQNMRSNFQCPLNNLRKDPFVD